MIIEASKYTSQRAGENTQPSSKKNGKKKASHPAGDEHGSRTCIDRANGVAEAIFDHLKLDIPRASSVLDDRPWDQVGDVVELDNAVVEFQIW
jgi:hypothetical protein